MTTMTTDERLGRLEAGQAGIYERLDRLEAGHVAIHQRLDDTNRRLDDTNTRITETNARITETNSRLDKVIFTLFGVGAGVIATLVTAIFTLLTST